MLISPKVLWRFCLVGLSLRVYPRPQSLLRDRKTTRYLVFESTSTHGHSIQNDWLTPIREVKARKFLKWIKLPVFHLLHIFLKSFNKNAFLTTFLHPYKGLWNLLIGPSTTSLHAFFSWRNARGGIPHSWMIAQVFISRITRAHPWSDYC